MVQRSSRNDVEYGGRGVILVATYDHAGREGSILHAELWNFYLNLY